MGHEKCGDMQSFRCCVIGLAICSLVPPVIPAQTVESEYVRLENCMVSRGNEPTSYDFSWVTPRIRADLIRYASTTKSDDLPKPQFISPDEARFYLGDPDIIQAHVKAYRLADGGENMWGPPDVLPYLMDDLVHASSTDHIGVVGRYSLMDTSLISSCVIIYQWTPFPEKTRSFAADLSQNLLFYKLGPTSKGNLLMREWWEHNKEAVQSRRYNEANWVPSADEMKQ